MNIHNFTNRHLCEYQTIFPDIASLLDHLLFVIGNGYEFDYESRMIYSVTDGVCCFIDQYPDMSDTEWDALIAACHAKELNFHTQFAHGKDINQDDLAEDCAGYRRVSVDDSMFTEDALYQQLCIKAQEKIDEAGEFGDPGFVRPYPLSSAYSVIFKLNERTPAWFLQIALNFCNAWVRFLDKEIETNNVWIQPSLRPAGANDDFFREVMDELAAHIKDDKEYDGWLENVEERTVDYADLTWTTKHRNIIQTQVDRLQSLLTCP